MMAQKHLHELLKEDQEPFQLKHYISDKRCQLKRLNKNSVVSLTKKQKPITTTKTLTKNVCFFSFQDSPDVRKSPLNFPSPVKKTPPRTKMFLHVPASTSSILLEAAMRIQKQDFAPKAAKNQNSKVGFGLFASILKKLKNKKREIKNGVKNDEKRCDESQGRLNEISGVSCSCNNSGISSSAEKNKISRERLNKISGLSCSCNNSSAGWSENIEEENTKKSRGRLNEISSLSCSCNNSSAGWSESIEEEKTKKTGGRLNEISGLSCSCNNSSVSWSESNEEEKSMDFETSSSCRSEIEEIDEEELINGDFSLCEKKFCSSPMSPFRFSLQRCPSNGRRTPEFSSPVASPARHSNEDKENNESANIEQEEEEEKEQCSPVSVLDAPFDDNGHEDEDEEEDCRLDCNYALVQRAQQQLLYKLRRFEKLAELDPIELEKLMLDDDEEDNDDLDDQEECQDYVDDGSVLSYRKEDFDSFASEVTIPFDMKRLVSDLMSEEKTEEANNLNNGEVVFGRVCKRLDSWQYVRSDTIDMMVESDLKTEVDDWKMFQQQREETAMEFEVSIFRLLVEELAEDLVHLAGLHGDLNKVFA